MDKEDDYVYDRDESLDALSGRADVMMDEALIVQS